MTRSREAIRPHPIHPALTDKEYNDLIFSKDARKAAIVGTITGANEILKRDLGTVDTYVICPGWRDVNCYYFDTNNDSRVLHARVGPDPEDASKLRLSIRELDPEIMAAEIERTSIGDEYEAVRRIIQEPISILDTPASVARLLKKKFPRRLGGATLKSAEPATEQELDQSDLARLIRDHSIVPRGTPPQEFTPRSPKAVDRAATRIIKKFSTKSAPKQS
jgi:hypothetical protein